MIKHDSSLLALPPEIICLILEKYRDFDGVICSALTCKPLCDFIIELVRHREQSEGTLPHGRYWIKTSYAACLSSPERMQWILSFPMDQRPYFLQEGNGINEKTAKFAARAGHLDTLRFLDANGFFWQGTDTVVMAAIINGHLPVLEFLHDIDTHGAFCHSEMATWWAALAGHLPVLEFLHAKGYPYDSRTFTYATQGGNLSVLKFLHEKGCRVDRKEVTRIATERGHLDILRFLFEKRYLLVNLSVWWAEEGNQSEILEFLYTLSSLSL